MLKLLDDYFVLTINSSSVFLLSLVLIYLCVS